MKWSWKIGRFAGIDVYIHATFILMLAFFGFSYWTQTRTLAGTAEGLAMLLVLFLSVLLHEYGHALTARRFGIRTRDISLLPIGGVARLERMPENPRQEFWVAMAGPAVNLVIAAALFAYLTITKTLVPLSAMTLTSGPFVERLMEVNIGLVLFNLLPAFPMDGGRVFRSLLALRMEYIRATQIAAKVGQAMAFLFGVFGLFNNPLLILIALFIWTGARQEAELVKLKHALAGAQVRQAMRTEFKFLYPSDRLGQVIPYLLGGAQQDFPVVEGERVTGMLSRAELLAAIPRSGEDALVAEIARRDFKPVAPSEPLETAINHMQETGHTALPVVQLGRLVGLLTVQNVGEFLSLRAAMAQRRLDRNPA